MSAILARLDQVSLVVYLGGLVLLLVALEVASRRTAS